MTRKVNFPGKLPASVVARLPLEVQKARAAYLSDSQQEISDLFASGVRELAKDDKGRTVSLDAMLEAGYQIDTDSNVYEPDGDEFD